MVNFELSKSFSISGDGALPRINILYPTLKDVLGNGILNFVRMPVGQTQTLPFSLVNVGSLASQIHIDLEDRENFRLIPCNDKGNKILIQSNGSSMTHTAQVTLEPAEEAHMMVAFKSNQVGTFNSHILITVLDNEFENTKCNLTAECYKETVCLKNLPQLPIELLGSTMDNLLNFGDLAINDTKVKLMRCTMICFDMHTLQLVQLKNKLY